VKKRYSRLGQRIVGVLQCFEFMRRLRPAEEVSIAGVSNFGSVRSSIDVKTRQLEHEEVADPAQQNVQLYKNSSA
jgi:hypothetical protein